MTGIGVEEAELRVGQVVRVRETHRRGEVADVDEHLHVVRIEFSNGTEAWVRVDELEPIPPRSTGQGDPW